MDAEIRAHIKIMYFPSIIQIKEKQTSNFLLPTVHLLLPTFSYYAIPPYVIIPHFPFSTVKRNFFESLTIQTCLNTIMETIHVNQASRSPFISFTILCNQILLPCNQGTVIFSNFVELAGVSLAPPWVLNSYSATRMLNRRVLHIIRYVCICIIVVAGTTCTAWARGRSQNAANVPLFLERGTGHPYFNLSLLVRVAMGDWEFGSTAAAASQSVAETSPDRGD